MRFLCLAYEFLYMYERNFTRLFMGPKKKFVPGLKILKINPEFKKRESHIKTHDFHSDSNSSVDVGRYEIKRREVQINTHKSHSDSYEYSDSKDVECYMVSQRQLGMEDFGTEDVVTLFTEDSLRWRSRPKILRRF